MALVPLRLLLDHAAENNYGIPAFNVNNLEQVQAIMEAASETDSPVILQASRGARSYAGEIFLRHLIIAATETYPNIPVVMHQDHGNDPSTCYSAAINGFTFALAKEVATRNITVNTITPGYIHTDTVDVLSDKQKDTIMTWIPMDRFGEVDDIAHMVAYLASEKAKYITGQIISVDGGMAI